MRAHPLVWFAWSVSAMIVASTTSNPLGSVLTIAAIGVIASSFARPEAKRVLRTVGLAAVIVVAIRVVLFSLTGRAGVTTLFEIPAITLPVWLGGFELGGAISGEVLASEVADGLRIVAIMLAATAFVVTADPTALLRRMPRHLRHLGVLLAIALTFVPSLVVAAAEVREAQRMRGHRTRRLRDVGPMVVPVLASALDRAGALAESMHARGFHRISATRAPRASLKMAERITVIASSVPTVVALVTVGARAWSAYPRLAFPPLDAGAFLGVALLLPPLLLVARVAPAPRSAPLEEPVA